MKIIKKVEIDIEAGDIVKWTSDTNKREWLIATVIGEGANDKKAIVCIAVIDKRTCRDNPYESHIVIIRESDLTIELLLKAKDVDNKFDALIDEYKHRV